VAPLDGVNRNCRERVAAGKPGGTQCPFALSVSFEAKSSRHGWRPRSLFDVDETIPTELSMRTGVKALAEGLGP